MLAAPVMLALLLVDITLAIYARSLPQLNVLVLSFAIKVVVGMMLLAVSLKWTQWTFDQLYKNTFAFWSQQAVPL
jgi:flagellar biosynthetic protein FliR